jgi:hypothetical protein
MANVSELFDELIARAVQLSDKYDVVRVTDVVQLLVAVKQLAAQAQTPPVINAALCLTCMYGPYCDCDMLCSRAVVIEDKYKAKE